MIGAFGPKATASPIRPIASYRGRGGDFLLIPSPGSSDPFPSPTLPHLHGRGRPFRRAFYVSFITVSAPEPFAAPAPTLNSTAVDAAAAAGVDGNRLLAQQVGYLTHTYDVTYASPSAVSWTALFENVLRRWRHGAAFGVSNPLGTESYLTCIYVDKLRQPIFYNFLYLNFSLFNLMYLLYFQKYVGILFQSILKVSLYLFLIKYRNYSKYQILHNVSKIT